MELQPYERQVGESTKAYAAFEHYYPLPPAERSIDAAWRAANQQQKTRAWHVDALGQ